jgi:hypothetical protein
MAGTHIIEMKVFLKNYSNVEAIETFKVHIDHCIVNSFTHAGNNSDPNEFLTKDNMVAKGWNQNF